MNIEDQHIEFKESWHDEYMKTLSAFANSDGGSLFIGVNDSGKSVGIENINYLLENLPNKIIQKLNIYADVNLVERQSVAVIEIKVNKYDSPVSFNGKYYLRKGSTTQELADKELHRFLLEKNKQTWESVIEENATLNDLDFETIERFKRLAKDNIKGIESESPEMVLRKLRLIDENKKLKRAAILLFGKEPRNFFISAYFKIGKFASLTEIITDNVVEGNLFQQLDDVVDLLRTKYLMRKVTGYENWQRKEELEYPDIAIREAVINALIHKDYTGSHIQMKIFPDSIWLWNSGGLMEGLTIDMLKTNHESVLRNELICNTFYKAGFIESWGRGTIKMIDACKSFGIPEPTFKATEHNFTIQFTKDKFTEEFIKSLNLNERQIKIINYLKMNKQTTSLEYANMYSISRSTATRELNHLVETKILVIIGENKNTQYQLNTNIV